jgi:hypothetical protein
MLGSLSQGNHMQILPAFRVGHVDDAALEPAEQIDALLLVREAVVLLSDDGVIEHLIATLEVQTMLTEIGFAFGIVPGDHDPQM